MLRLNRFMIVNPITGAFKGVYSAKTMPALYTTRGIAEGELRKQKKNGRGSFRDFVVVEVEVMNKYEW
jgi:hypothetical protein